MEEKELNIEATITFEKNYDALFCDNKRFIVNQGGSRCFAGDTLIQTLNGNKRIDELVEGDMVKTMNEDTKEIIWKPVMSIFHSKNNTKPSIRIKMKNGDIIECTLDHKFYYNESFISIKEILKLK